MGGVVKTLRRSNSLSRSVFSTHVSLEYAADIRGSFGRTSLDQKLRGGPRNLGKTSIWGADIHDPSARMSMTPGGGGKKVRAEKLGADFLRSL